jgi:tRNA G26 N,N-dimethylase Trm1
LHPKSLFLLPTNVATNVESANVEMITKTLIFNTIDVAFGSKLPFIPSAKF